MGLNDGILDFEGFRITKSGKTRNSIFHHITKENTIPDYEIRNAPRVILEKNRTREERHKVEKKMLKCGMPRLGLPWRLFFCWFWGQPLRLFYGPTTAWQWGGWGQVLPSPSPYPFLIYLPVTLPISNEDEKLSSISIPDGFGYPRPRI
ncbi:hypothetical protein MTR_5g017000 [Medicago truncatula]|uniref:Uncharacterized protein n=1 Tax=Medicago truncatula TaxID=3880 RepID=G7K6L0_MEDTR|nr:hypothetical protein MTR_5g017000 [Medicago truncatula]